MPWIKACGEEECIECGETLSEGEDVYDTGDGVLCEGCNDDLADEEAGMWDSLDDRGYDDYPIDGVGFADPGGRSALRAETEDNPRNLPCGTCGEPNKLTPLDKARGYQCDGCADAAECGY